MVVQIMSVKFGILLSCYEKTDDLLAHLDILSFNPRSPKIAVAYLHDDDPPKLRAGTSMLRMKSPGFAAGTLLSLTAGIRWAAENDLDYLVYRNADDWFFDHDLSNSWIDRMVEEDKMAAAYNWLTFGTYEEFAMNENIFKVTAFLPSVDHAEKQFLAMSKMVACECSIAWWLKCVIKDMDKGFMRLPDREQRPGVGYEMHQLFDVFKKRYHRDMSAAEVKLLENNQRFFNRKWKMIGSHDNKSRKHFYNQIRASIPYVEKLERCRHFKRWLRSAESGSQWNKPEDNISRKNLLRPKSKIVTKKEFPRRLFKAKVSTFIYRS